MRKGIVHAKQEKGKQEVLAGGARKCWTLKPNRES